MVKKVEEKLKILNDTKHGTKLIEKITPEIIKDQQLILKPANANLNSKNSEISSTIAVINGLISNQISQPPAVPTLNFNDPLIISSNPPLNELLLQKNDANNKYRQQTQPIRVDTTQTKPDSYSHRQQISTSRLASRNKKLPSAKKSTRTKTEPSCILAQIAKPASIKSINNSNRKASIKSYVNRSTSINGCDIASGALSKNMGKEIDFFSYLFI